MNILKLGIVGNGFVGGSVAYGFVKNVNQIIVDPQFNNTTLKECVEQEPSIIFICVPTPQNDDNDVNVDIANTVLKEIDELKYSGIVVIKSTITPKHLIKFKSDYNLRLVYNPEFLTEVNAHWDFCNPPMQILGGDWEDCEEVEKAYVQHSNVKVVPTFKTDIITASLLKYTINSWLATKVIFMNELNNLHEKSGAESTWEQFTDMLARDSRIGNSHLMVPGPDGHFGFGGHCFPKDTFAFRTYANELGVDMTVLEQAITTNLTKRVIKYKQPTTTNLTKRVTKCET